MADGVSSLASFARMPRSWAGMACMAWVGMALGLGLFYRSHAPLVMLVGGLVFCALAVLQTDRAVLAVIVAAPFFFIPAQIDGLRAAPLRLPLHEAALLLVLVATLARWQGKQLWRRISTGTTVWREWRITLRWQAVRYHMPVALLVVSGALGVAWAVPEGRGAALREFRWLIIEPMLFWALLRGMFNRPGMAGARNQARAAGVFIASGAVVAAVGVLQFVNIDLVWLFGTKQSAVASIVAEPGLWRVTSVYGSPNNLGLYLGRVWPLALALLLALPATARQRGCWWLLAAGVVCCLAGIAVSFSRGAWLAVGAALVVLAAPSINWSARQHWLRYVVLLGTACAVLAGMALSVRGGLISPNTMMRMSFWREGWWLIQQHPLGIGLDQFFFYHNPLYGRSQLSVVEQAAVDPTAAHPHNLLLDLWLRLGPLGSIAFGWLLWRFVHQARVVLHDLPHSYAAWRTRGACAAMAAALVHGLIDQFYFVPDLAFAFWLLLALVEAAYLQRNQHATSEAVPVASEHDIMPAEMA